MWRDAWSRARCLIPAEGWYEWQAVERAPARSSRRRPAGALAQIHERAPLVLSESAQDAWLDRRLVDARQVSELVRSRVPPEAFTHYEVRLLVNDTGLDGPELIEPLEE